MGSEMCIRDRNYWDVFLGDISFYLVVEFVLSFSSRSYPSVRKCTDCSGMNMSTNMALKTRTRCYYFDQSVRKCNDHLVFIMMNKNGITFPDGVVSTTVFLLLCETSCPPQQQEQGLPAAVPGLGTTDAKLHCCCCDNSSVAAHRGAGAAAAPPPSFPSSTPSIFPSALPVTASFEGPTLRPPPCIYQI